MWPRVGLGRAEGEGSQSEGGPGIKESWEEDLKEKDRSEGEIQWYKERRGSEEGGMV